MNSNIITKVQIQTQNINKQIYYTLWRAIQEKQ